MGFIPENNKTILTAFLTQKGRTYYISGTESDRKVVYFSLGDSDTNYLISANDENYLYSGFIPDLTGNYENCIKTITDGVELESLIFSKSNQTVNNYEIRFFDSNNVDGINSLNIKVDLKKYITWLKKYSEYSSDNTQAYNKVQNDLSSPFIKLFDRISIFDVDNNVEVSNTDLYFELSQGDYKNFEQLNRFILDTSLPDDFKLVLPTSNRQSSPLEFIFSSLNSTDSKFGNGGLIINNRDYIYIVNNLTDNIITRYTTTEMINGVQLDTTKTYDIKPAVVLRYYKDGVINEELFQLRTTNLNTFNNFSVNNSNQYLKMFINSSNKTLATREAELLEEFIINRIDLFNNINNKYVSKPFTLLVKSNSLLNKFASIKIQFVYDTNQTYSVLPNDTFII